MQCITAVNTSNFVYGADGIRRQSMVNGTTTDFIVDNSLFIRERNHATGVNLVTYLVGFRGPEYRRDDVTNQLSWYVYDGLGSVLGEVNANGSIISSRKYDVYGLIRGGNNAGGTSNHKFVGQLGHPSEETTGLICMQARYYDPAIGRFICEDSARQGANWFVYCGDNPVNRLDATGNNWWQLFQAWLNSPDSSAAQKQFQDSTINLLRYWDATRNGSRLFGFVDPKVELVQEYLLEKYEALLKVLGFSKNGAYIAIKGDEIDEEL